MTQDIHQLIVENQGIIWNVTRTFYLLKEDREDLFQDIVVRVIENYPSFRHESKFSTWLYRVALNTAISHKKKKKSFISLAALFKTPIQKKNDNAYDSSDISMLYRAINNLNKIEKAIILLYLEEKSYQEISDVIGLTVKNISVKLVRIKKKLGEIMRSME
ncbi:MAG: sigma-70 family RNA polymerase sigma factor [Bacteroidales bacterium]